jgi:uncharacterized membrane protein
MNAAHFHLMFNHFPIAGLVFAILLNLLAIFRKSPELKKLACWFYILVGLLSILPIVTGDGAHEILKTYPGMDNDAIEYHETMGYIFFYGMLLNGTLAIAALWFSRGKPDLLKKLIVTMLIIALAVFVFACLTGSTGGKIRHPELEHGIYKK